MSRFMVDAPVSIKWFVPEIHSSPAARLLDGGIELYAPDTLLTDAGRIISTKARLGELSPDEAAQVVKAIGSVPFMLLPSHALLEPALRVAAALDLPLVEGMGIAAAMQCECRLVTAGRTLYDRMQGTPFSRYVKWVGDIR